MEKKNKTVKKTAPKKVSPKKSSKPKIKTLADELSDMFKSQEKLIVDLRNELSREKVNCLSLEIRCKAKDREIDDLVDNRLKVCGDYLELVEVHSNIPKWIVKLFNSKINLWKK